MNSDHSSSNTGKLQTSVAGRIAFGALGILLVSIVLTYAVLYFGSVNGEEFSSDTFQRRRFAYLQLPLIGIQITPISHTKTTNDLEEYLVSEKLFTKPAKPENRWDLVQAMKGVRGGTPGDARILCSYLDAENSDGDRVWKTWSEENVELAKILWPVVAKVARQELYSFIPDLFILARSASSPEQLEQAIDETLADKYFVTAETLETLGQEKIAAELFAEVLHHVPERADAVRERDHP